MTDLKKATSHWYAKLKAEGFSDIENHRQELKVLDPRTKVRAENDRLKREAYFDAADIFLHSFKFKKPRDQAIWEKHCEGHSIRAIARHLQSTRHIVDYTIKRLRNKAQLKGLYSLSRRSK